MLQHIRSCHIIKTREAGRVLANILACMQLSLRLVLVASKAVGESRHESVQRVKDAPTPKESCQTFIW